MKQTLGAGILKILNLEYGQLGLWKKWNVENLEDKNIEWVDRILNEENFEHGEFRMCKKLEC